MKFTRRPESPVERGRADLAVHPLATMEPDEVRSWIEANATSFKAMREVVIWLAVAVVLSLRGRKFD